MAVDITGSLVSRDVSVALVPCGHQRFCAACVTGGGMRPHMPALSLLIHDLLFLPISTIESKVS